MYVLVDAVPANSSLDVIGQIGEWYEVSYAGDLAYVFSSLVFDQPLSQSSVQQPATASPVSTVAPPSSSRASVDRFAAPLRRYTHGQVNLRQGPGTSFDLAGSVSAGSTLDVVGQSGDWYVIMYNGTEAYIAGWLTFDSPLAQPVQQQPASVQQQPVAQPQSPGNTTAPTTPAQSGVTYVRNCTQAKELGIAPMSSDHPAYRSALDRDGDGTACDK